MVFNKQPLISHSTLPNQIPYFFLLAKSPAPIRNFPSDTHVDLAGCNISAAVAQDSYCTKENFELKFWIKIKMHAMSSKLDSSITNKKTTNLVWGSLRLSFSLPLFLLPACHAMRESATIQRDFLSLNLLISRTLILYPSGPAPHACLWRNYRPRCLRCRFQQEHRFYFYCEF